MTTINIRLYSFFTNITAALALLMFTFWNVGASAKSVAPYAMPEPLYDIEIERHIKIEMRDGIQLATDIYRPIGVKGKLPVILIRTPYDRKTHRKAMIYGGRVPSPARFWAGQGYAVAVQDVRGKFDSEGVFVPFTGDALDGYDTVEWLAKQTWASGKVGSYGCSHLGDTQIMTAQSKPPHLAAMIPQAAGGVIGSADGRYRYFGARVGGATAFSAGVGWMHQRGSQYYLRYPEGIDRETLLKMEGAGNTLPGGSIPSGNFSEAWRVLPLTDIPTYLNSQPNAFNDVMFRDLTDPWWDQFQYLNDDTTFNVPTLHVNSWYDYGINETILEWELFQKNGVSKTARDNQFMILSPTVHCESERIVGDKTIVGERSLGDARYDYWRIYLDWFAYWLKGEKNAITDMPKVQYYMMGSNEWRSADTWPPKGVQFKNFYLHSKGKANGRLGDGQLKLHKPQQQVADHYTYDPATPAPSLGGLMCCTGTNESVAGAFDQSEIQMRSDILVYTSEALTQPVEVAGPIKVQLYVSSSAKDTDFVAKLIDVYPDGRAFNVQEGILRARYREGMDKKVWMEKGKVYPISIDLQATANTFLPGHKIRLQISSSNFPAWDRNLNTGGNNFDETQWVVAQQKIYHNSDYPSHIVLPVMNKKVSPFEEFIK